MIRTAPALFFLGFSGCWVSSSEIATVVNGDADADADADSDADSDADADVSFSLDPDQGPAGQQVHVLGGPFAEDVVVKFGSTNAGILSTSSDDVLVEVPNGSEGYVDVTVASAAGPTPPARPFFRWQSGLGKTGAIGEIAWYDYVGGYWDSAGDYGDAYVDLIHPANVHFTDVYGPSGVSSQCELDWSSSPSYQNYPAFGDTMTLSTRTGRVIALTNDGTGWNSPELTSDNWANGQDWDLSLPGNGDWPDLDVPAFVHTPDPITVTSPAIGGTIAPFVSGGDDLNWSTTGAGDFVVIFLVRYEGTTAVEDMTCVVPDDGQFTLPYSWEWGGWSFGDQMTIYVGRMTLGDAVLPSGASVEVAGARYAVGAAFQD